MTSTSVLLQFVSVIVTSMLSAVDVVTMPAFACYFDVSVLCIVAVCISCDTVVMCCACVLSVFICLNSLGYVY